ncbi:MAG: malectin domain-containing carbohydrate-binding protein [Actinomycetes bacterium]
MRRSRFATVVAAFAAFAATAGMMGLGPAGASVAQPTLVNTNPADFTPNVTDGKVLAIAQVGNTIVLGGTFSSVTSANGATTYTRSRLVAFDATTGAVSTTFKPAPNGSVEALAPSADGKSLYVGGTFTSVDGAAGTSRLVRLDVSNGTRVAGFTTPTINGPIRDMKRFDSTLYISGGFSTVGGQPRGRMASLDALTGARTDKLNVAFTGVNNGGTTTVNKFDVSPDGSRIVAIGNFNAVNTQPRSQIAMIDTSGTSATLSSWSTDIYPNYCASVFNTYMRDLDFSPDGAYFIVSTTGAYGGADSYCDTITRWETANNGGGQLPSWTDHTGGDTTYAVAATGTAVYIGGHMRWVNNPYAGDAAGPGAVPRQGIAALDPSNGLPFSWNPTRSRGVGVFDFLATSQGLWLGSDTNKIGGETHAKIALMPLAGGKTIPAVTIPNLPGTVLQLGRYGGSTDPSVLFRVNAGGPELESVDDGPNWAADNAGDSPYRNSGSNWVEAWNQSVTRDSSVPNTDTDRAPMALFDSERWDPGSQGDNAADEMQWNFPVTSGTPLTVRLYFANQCGCTASVGARVFDVAIDGSTKLSNFDMVALKGDRVGFVQSFNVTADGNGLDIGFTHIVENPLVNGIEIIDRSVTPPTTIDPALSQVRRTPLSALEVPGATTTAAGSETFHNARGAFVVNNTLYTPWLDGTLRARTITGSTIGTSVRTVNLYNGTFTNDAPSITGIVYDPGTSRIYYTMSGQNQLFWRWFTPESEVVGARRYDVDSGALNASQVGGMFLSGGSLYYALRSDGDLYRVGFNAGVSGSATLVDSSRDWTAQGMTLSGS